MIGNQKIVALYLQLDIYVILMYITYRISFATYLMNSRSFIYLLYCCSVAEICLTVCDPVACSTPGFPVPHHLPAFAQVHVHRIGDAVQPSHFLLPSSPSARIRVFSNEFAVHMREACWATVHVVAELNTTELL